MRIFILLIKWILCFSSALSMVHAESSSERMCLQLDIIKSIFQVQYAPKNWKKDHCGWDLNEAIQAAQEKVISSENLSIKEFRRILKGFFHSCQDYHTDIFFYSTEEASLPFKVKPVNGKLLVSNVFRQKFAFSSFSVRKGDELVSIDKRPAWEVLEELRDNELGMGNPNTNLALAAEYLTHRQGMLGHQIPRGSVEMCFVSSRYQTSKIYQLQWDYQPEKIIRELLSKFAFVGKIDDFCASSSANFESICEHMIEKFDDEDAKKGNFNNKMDFRKKSINHQDWVLTREQESAWSFLKREMILPRYGAQTASELCPRSDGDSLGARESFIPKLGSTWWNAQNNALFHAYLFELPSRRLAGYVRIPHYKGSAEHLEEFGKLIDFFQEKAEVLVIDQVNNPGGSLLYLYALASMLTKIPLMTPKHRVSLTHLEAATAATMKPLLKKIKNDKDAQYVLGSTIDGYPVNLQTTKNLEKYLSFLEEQWNAGKNLSDPCCIYGIANVFPHPKHQFTKPIIILANSLDFSCGDFFPALFQDNKQALIFGERTAGAGGMFTTNTYPNPFGIRSYHVTISIAERSSNGYPIENLGVEPDIFCSLTENDLNNSYTDYKNKLLDVLEGVIDGRNSSD